jgi:hypothetical protein
VQRTGWGKSLVYFIATRLLREITQNGIAFFHKSGTLRYEMALTCQAAERIHEKKAKKNQKFTQPQRTRQ